MVEQLTAAGLQAATFDAEYVALRSEAGLRQDGAGVDVLILESDPGWGDTRVLDLGAQEVSLFTVPAGRDGALACVSRLVEAQHAAR